MKKLSSFAFAALAVVSIPVFASSFDDALERYLDLRESKASVIEKLTNLYALKPAVEALVKSPPAYPHRSNVEFLSLSLLFTELEYLSQISTKPMSSLEFETFRRPHVEGAYSQDKGTFFVLCK